MNKNDQILSKARIYIKEFEVSDPENIEKAFKALFASKEAEEAKSVVYFYEASSSIPCKIGASPILYIGKTKSNLKKRYLPYVKKISNGKNGEYYKDMVKSHGPIKLSYFTSKNPRADEAQCFREFRKKYGQNPDKSKRG
jgi:hypothetical protein